MKLKLIRTAGFAGRTKTAETDLSHYPYDIQTCIEELFSKTEVATFSSSPARDKETLLLEFDGKCIPMEKIKPDDRLEKIVGQLLQELHY